MYTTVVVVELLAVLALAFAAIDYVDWSSDAAFAELMTATTSSASDPNYSEESSTPVKPNKKSGFRWRYIYFAIVKYELLPVSRRLDAEAARIGRPQRLELNWTCSLPLRKGSAFGCGAIMQL
jgi:hypothetical protein